MFTFDDISLKKILVPVDGSNQSKEALRRAAHLAQQFDATLTLISVVELGKVMSGVQQVHTGYDLVVIGSRGLGKIKGIIIGSVSQQVAQECRCPVLVIHG